MSDEHVDMDIPEVIIFNGIKYQLMGTKRYYLSQSTTNEGRRHAKGLHVAIYEFYSGETVPKGFVVHHRDGNPHNNNFENLECIPRNDHAKLYKSKNPEKQQEHLNQIRELSKEWHASPEGLEWHREHGKNCWNNKEYKEFNCIYCGKSFLSRDSSVPKYCSNGCGYKHRRSIGYYDRKIKCQECGKEFDTTVPINPNKIRKFCSRKCAGKSLRRSRLQSND